MTTVADIPVSPAEARVCASKGAYGPMRALIDTSHLSPISIDLLPTPSVAEVLEILGAVCPLETHTIRLEIPARPQMYKPNVWVQQLQTRSE